MRTLKVRIVYLKSLHAFQATVLARLFRNWGCYIEELSCICLPHKLNLLLFESLYVIDIITLVLFNQRLSMYVLYCDGL